MTITQSKTEILSCKHCGLPGKEEVTRIGAQDYHFVVFDCSCEQEAITKKARIDEERRREREMREQATRRAESLLAFAQSVGSRAFMEATFENFIVDERNASMVIQAQHWGQAGARPSLLLSGGSAIGKTRLVLAVARRAIEQSGSSVIFEQASALLRRLRGLYPSAQVSELAKLKAVNILILDDLGILPRQDRSTSEDILLEIIDFRYRHEKAILMTTNVSVADFKSVFGPRIASRLKDSFFVAIASWGGPNVPV